jgi:hypothetical protein
MEASTHGLSHRPISSRLADDGQVSADPARKHIPRILGSILTKYGWPWLALVGVLKVVADAEAKIQKAMVPVNRKELDHAPRQEQ